MADTCVSSSLSFALFSFEKASEKKKRKKRKRDDEAANGKKKKKNKILELGKMNPGELCTFLQ